MTLMQITAACRPILSERYFDSNRQLPGDFIQLHPAKFLSQSIPLSEGFTAYYSRSKLLIKCSSYATYLTLYTLYHTLEP